MKARFYFLLTFVLLALLAAFLLSRKLNPTTPPITENGKPIPQKTLATHLNLDFEKWMIITQKWVETDGRAPITTPCAGKNQAIGAINLDPQLSAEITCDESYLGGVKIRLQQLDGEPKEISLAQTEAEPGQQWDLRSLLTRTAGGLLKIESVMLTSTQEPGADDSLISCDVNRTILIWNPVKGDFDELNNENEDLQGQLTPDRFTPPISADEKCLTPQGNWRM